MATTKGVLIDGGLYHRFLYLFGGVGEMKYPFQEGVNRNAKDMFDSLDVYAVDYGREGYPDWVAPIDLGDFGAKGQMGKVIRQWHQSGVLARMSQRDIETAERAANEDPLRQYQSGAGAVPEIARAGYEAVRHALIREVSASFVQRMIELKWPRVIVYVAYGVGGGTGRGIAPVFVKDLRVAIDTVLENNGVKTAKGRQQAATIVSLAFSHRAYSYQAFTETGEQNERADLMIERSNTAMSELSQALFINGEVGYRALDVILRQSPGWMRKVVNAKSDGYLPLALVSVRSQTHRQLLRMAAFALQKPTHEGKLPVWWRVQYEPANPYEAARKLVGQKYKEVKKYDLHWHLPYKPDSLDENMTLAKLVKAAATYRYAKELFDQFVREYGDAALHHEKIDELRLNLEAGLRTINTLVVRLRELAGQTGLYVYSWEAKIFNATLSMRVKEIIAGTDNVIGHIPPFDDDTHYVAHLVGKSDKAAIRESYSTRTADGYILFEMGGRWRAKPTFRDDASAITAEELAKLVDKAMLEADRLESADVYDNGS